jgi:myo-inositol-1(or 4)-monophosphatase
MSSLEWVSVKEKAEIIIKQAADLIKKSFEKELIVEYKSNPNDLVTEIDKEVELFFKNEIAKQFPQHYILGEEGTGNDLKTLDGIVWIIDPIDGTTNFVHQQRHFAISVGIYENGVGMVGLVYDVMADEFFSAVKGQGAFLNGQKLPMLKEAKVEDALIAVNSYWIVNNESLVELVKRSRGIRSYGAAALEMTAVAANRLDAYISLRLSPWDFAASAIIIHEVGANITTVDGEKVDLLNPCSICVAKDRLFEELQSNYFTKR